ncbi:glycosyltransferase family 2 protein [Laspinema olomoucense]|uniref:Glycosyltransferase n=1 Tax=Laspinema olomoucense D3b TaxID=2953688 RepID=A0ABT2NG15_9CYAN|nr:MULTISPECIES: glycosyltransferase [unclassified Laspinema]MCT7981633.1 glycosyltransferase [Laspinema sp. D3b]MCT7997251.1 glycosyltransferase [Laspinema sp. D3c]
MTPMSLDKITLSVIIPCYNQGEYILDAIASVEDCFEANFELIIVNDGSTEPLTLEVLDYLQKQEYQIIHQSNQGLATARNVGIKASQGKYILALDADNKIRPNYIIKGSETLDKFPPVGVVYGDKELFGDRTGIWQVPDFDPTRLLQSNYIDACAVFRKTLWQDCGGYDPNIPDKLGFEDWDLWLSALEKRWEFYHIPEVLFDYRVRAKSMVTRCLIPENQEKLIRYLRTKHQTLYQG